MYTTLLYVQMHIETDIFTSECNFKTFAFHFMFLTTNCTPMICHACFESCMSIHWRCPYQFSYDLPWRKPEQLAETLTTGNTAHKRNMHWKQWRHIQWWLRGHFKYRKDRKSAFQHFDTDMWLNHSPNLISANMVALFTEVSMKRKLTPHARANWGLPLLYTPAASKHSLYTMCTPTVP